MSENDFSNALKSRYDSAASAIEGIQAIADSKFELIETINVLESVNSIIRTTTPDGDLYDYKALLVQCDFPAVVTAAGMVIAINNTDIIKSPGLISRYGTHRSFMFEVEYGRILGSASTDNAALDMEGYLGVRLKPTPLRRLRWQYIHQAETSQ